MSFAALGLAVIDEQHRSVEQRSQLEAKAGGDQAPHVLLMTATPIPRTLGQVLYADSTSRTPDAAGGVGVPIRTGIRRPEELAGTWQKVPRRGCGRLPDVRRRPPDREAEADDASPACRRGPQGFWDASAPAAEAEAVRLRAGAAPGRDGPRPDEGRRLRRRDGGTGMARDREVLVGSTVVEVGADVAEATMMVVQGADRFGLGFSSSTSSGARPAGASGVVLRAGVDPIDEIAGRA